jgi:hypothetical protein
LLPSGTSTIVAPKLGVIAKESTIVSGADFSLENALEDDNLEVKNILAARSFIT